MLCIGGFKVSLGWHVFLGTLGILIWERGGVREALASVKSRCLSPLGVVQDFGWLSGGSVISHWRLQVGLPCFESQC